MHLKMLRTWDSEDSGNKECFFFNRRLCTQVLTHVHFPARRDMFEGNTYQLPPTNVYQFV